VADHSKGLGRFEKQRQLSGFKSPILLLTMATLPILSYPDPRLHTVAKPVAQIDARIAKLAADMLETMYAAKGVGLAATQVNVHERLIVIDVSEERNTPMVLINPEVVWQSAERCKDEEGCLSVPEYRDDVERAVQIHVKALDLQGQEQLIKAEGLLSVCIQHEMDHLKGKVFVQYLSSLKQSRVRSKLLKAQREEKAAARSV
jgi:peptide deformylase